MNLIEIFLLAVALSMDAFAVAVCAGLSGRGVKVRKMLMVGMYFGAAQAVMPIIGFVLAARFSEYIIAYSSLVAFAILTFLGAKMIWGSFKKDVEKEVAVSFAIMLPLAVATSVDALAVGISFAFLEVNIFTAALLIGITTFVISAAGVRIGSIFGAKYKAKAELLGGVILVGMGVHVLVG